MQYVFTYGTLRPGQGNASLIDGLHATTREAVLAGYTLWANGRYGFPYARPAADGHVVGVVYGLHDEHSVEALDRLDMLEGYSPENVEASHYLRKTVQVRLGDGSTLEAFVYVANPRTVTGRDLVAIGADWTTWNNILRRGV